MARAHKKARRHARRNPQGRLSVARGGFGFVSTPEGEYFVPKQNMHGAFDGDTVEIAPLSINHDRPQPGKAHNVPGRKPSARVVRVVQRARETLIGRYEIAEPFGVVVPENDHIKHDIFTMLADNPGVQDGDIVRVRITQFPTAHQAATGKVEQVIGHQGQAGLDIMAIIAKHDLLTEFPETVLAEAQNVRVDASAALAEGYRDLRDRCIFTIDPVDARDFDDALSLEPVDEDAGRWRLGVHIADVSHYVGQGTALDREAQRRGTSVYLVDRVIPMLPEQLSNDACSLCPHEDRLTMTVDIVIREDGSVMSYECFPAVIRSCARLDYGQVQAFLDGDTADAAAVERARHIPQEVHSRLLGLDRIARQLEVQRRRAGALDLDSAEAHVVLDENGTPVDVAVRRTTRATSLVEQAMILANACVAMYLETRGWPCLYRVHEAPSPESLARLLPILQEYGLDKGIDRDLFEAGDPKTLQEVLEAARKADAGELVSMLLLRSLKRACYEPHVAQHFGLALQRYAHFTSPIRRYPDLVVHRMLVAQLRGDTEAAERIAPHLQEIADRSSAMERVADDAARESQELKLVEYLQSFIGEIFPGTIVRIVGYGFFVELENTAVGLVALGDAVDDVFALNVERQTLTGRESGVQFRLGQHVLVRLTVARPAERQLDFSLVSKPHRGKGC